MMPEAEVCQSIVVSVRLEILDSGWILPLQASTRLLP